MRKINKTDILRILRQQGLSLTFAFVALFAGVLYTFAWFQSREGLRTLTQVEAPSTLSIKGGNANDIIEVDLSGVDLTSAKHSAYFIFSIVGDSTSPYLIELAHTTNIPFTYKIYTAKRTDSTSGGDDLFAYVDPDNNTTYYQKNTALDGGYINKDIDADTIANGSQQAATYPTTSGVAYESVQQNARPLYWLSNTIQPSELVNGNFCDYYILMVTWNEGIQNEKETDLVYLLAQNDSTGSTT